MPLPPYEILGLSVRLRSPIWFAGHLLSPCWNRENRPLPIRDVACVFVLPRN